MTVALVFNSCSENGIDDNGNGNYKPADYSVKGKVEKGPFVSGSTINLQPMDEKLLVWTAVQPSSWVSINFMYSS